MFMVPINFSNCVSLNISVMINTFLSCGFCFAHSESAARVKASLYFFNDLFKSKIQNTDWDAATSLEGGFRQSRICGNEHCTFHAHAPPTEN